MKAELNCLIQTVWPEGWAEEGLKAKRELSMGGGFEEREKRREEKWNGHRKPVNTEGRCGRWTWN